MRPGQGDDTYRNNGAGEMLVYSAADYGDFQVERPDMPPNMEAELEWHRLLATIGGLASACHHQRDHHALDVFENVNATSHSTACIGCSTIGTIDNRNIERSQSLAAASPFSTAWPTRRVLRCATVPRPTHATYSADAEMGVPVGAGTDATRVASYNPWSHFWLVTGRTLGGLRPIQPPISSIAKPHCGCGQVNAWFSTEVGKKGQIKAGRFADLAVFRRLFLSQATIRTSRRC